MSSTLLYLAIVAVWAVVLVPMWLRRDNARNLARRADLTEELTLEEPTIEERDTAVEHHQPAPPPSPERRSGPRRRRTRA
ncbi:MAG TPA: hypothetical protein VHJ17_14125, partial [Thermomonospora sp.]|nr:hypothetical protein [Thermomonospora sp.]